MFLMVLLLAASHPASATRVRRQATAGHYKSKHRRSKKSHQVQGQKAIYPQRASEIQQALIREHYLS